MAGNETGYPSIKVTLVAMKIELARLDGWKEAGQAKQGALLQDERVLPGQT